MAALVLAGQVLAATRTVWQDEVEKAVTAGGMRFGAAIVDDAQASGGKAVRIPFDPKAQGWSVVFGAPKVELQGRCLFTFTVRGENMSPITDGMKVTLVAHDKQTGQWAFNHETRIYGTHLPTPGYTTITLPLDVPLTPETYGPEVILQWQAESEGVSPALYLDKAEIASQIFASPAIVEVLPAKVRYKPRETAAVRVTVANPTAHNCEATLVGEERREFDTSRRVFTEKVALAAGERKTVAAQWQLGPEEYGRELRVRLLVGGKEVDTGSELFGMSHLPLWVSAGNNYDRSYWIGDRHSMFYVSPASGQDSRRAVQFWQKLHKVYWEFFSWSPGDISDLAPQEDPFPGGEGRLTYRSKETIRQQTALIKSVGMWPVTYVNGSCWAESGYRLFAQHPEWFLYDSNGEVAVYDMASLAKHRHKDDFDFDPNTYPSIFFQAVLNHSLPEVQEYIARQLIRCGKEMGFAGARFDVRYIEVYPGERDFQGREIAKTFEEADRISAAAVKNVKALVHKELPDFTFGYNYASPEETKDMTLTMKERCEGGAWMLDEIPCTYQEKTSPYHLWKPYLRRMVSWGDQVRHWGGVYNPFDFRRNGGKYVVDNVYSSLIRIICGGRDYSGWYFNSRLPFGDLGAFATRFSQYLFSTDLQWLPEVKGEVEAQSKAPLWWQDTVYWSKSADGRRQLIVHLINPPKSEEVEENPRSEINPPVRDVQLVCASYQGKKPQAAWLLAAEPDEPTGDNAPRAMKLPLREAPGRKVAVTVPSVLFWKMVVFQY
jgi:hypothetical protein